MLTITCCKYDMFCLFSSCRYDADLTLFSPEGRLYQVEYVMRAVGNYGCPAVGVHGEGCCVVACKRDVPVRQSTTSI